MRFPRKKGLIRCILYYQQSANNVIKKFIGKVNSKIIVLQLYCFEYCFQTTKQFLQNMCRLQFICLSFIVQLQE